MREVYTQVPVTVRHGHFSKEYRLDLVADAAVYELKAVRQLVGEHDAQVLNYAMLLDISCIKLVNFRGARVMGRLRFSPVGIAARLGFRINSDGWKPLSAKCEAFKKAFLELINDLGAFLDTRLYEEALMALIPATEARLSVSADGRELGSHRTNMIAENVAFCVTAFSGPLTDHQSHLTRLLSCLPLRGLQWINLNHSEINLTTLIQGADT